MFSSEYEEFAVCGGLTSLTRLADVIAEIPEGGRNGIESIISGQCEKQARVVMLVLIAMLGRLLLMMGSHSRSESLFYYFHIEDQVPENHLLRLIDRHVQFDFVREKLRDCYSDTGRRSID